MEDCEICGKDIPRYRCPICRIRYCSADCFTTHRSKPCTPPVSRTVDKEEKKQLEPVYKYPTEDTVPVEKLNTLKDNADVKNCLENPHVRTIMKGILEAEDPTEAIAKAMIEPIFVELADACLEVVEPRD